MIRISAMLFCHVKGMLLKLHDSFVSSTLPLIPEYLRLHLSEWKNALSDITLLDGLFFFLPDSFLKMFIFLKAVSSPR